MARKKEYIEQEVIEKAMSLFWRNGYDKTSMHMLEKEMGINKFSIYSSFGSKHGVFLATLKSYQSKIKDMFDRFENANNGVADIKQFFYDSVAIGYLENNEKGCLVTDTYNEFSKSEDLVIKEQMDQFMENLKQAFQNKLRLDPTKSEATVIKQANYLVLAKHGLAAATKVNTKQEIEDYIEMLFINL